MSEDQEDYVPGQVGPNGSLQFFGDDGNDLLAAMSDAEKLIHQPGRPTRPVVVALLNRLLGTLKNCVIDDGDGVVKQVTFSSATPADVSLLGYDERVMTVKIPESEYVELDNDFHAYLDRVLRVVVRKNEASSRILLDVILVVAIDMASAEKGGQSYLRILVEEELSAEEFETIEPGQIILLSGKLDYMIVEVPGPAPPTTSSVQRWHQAMGRIGPLEAKELNLNDKKSVAQSVLEAVGATKSLKAGAAGKVRFMMSNGIKWRVGLVDTTPDNEGKKWYYLSDEVYFDPNIPNDPRRAEVVTMVMNWFGKMPVDGPEVGEEYPTGGVVGERITSQYFYY